ncbi:MAG: BLUF domain-containing protein [Planctomycetes bacterium]|nr:BLUF domain-containing protein [Planctomycetota bacterium]
MFHIIYVSSATIPFSNQDLLELLERARAANAALGITGMLLYKGGNFMQCLEGGHEAVTTLYERITTDRRHRGCLTLLKGDRAERQFPTWTMAFRDLDDPQVCGTPGYDAFLNQSFTGPGPTVPANNCWQLFETFRTGMR